MRSSVVRSLLSTLFVLAPAAISQGVDTKQAADALVRSIRELQNDDGTYGDSLADTCRVLDLLRRSPRHYCELDGPFFRLAARAVSEAPPQGSVDEQAWRLLALADCVTPAMRSTRDSLRDELAATPGLAASEPVARALRTVPPDGMVWPSAPPSAEPALACLLAEDPGQLPAPSLVDFGTWTRWARAARLRGLRPDPWPALPADLLAPADLPTLCARLDLVIAVHKLSETPPLPERELPAVVTTPRTREAALEQALAWLDEHQDNGTFGLGVPGWDGPEPGITALCLSAAIHAADALDQPRPAWVGAGLDYLVSLQKTSGAIYSYGVAVYTTSVAMEALLDGQRPEDEGVVGTALDYLLVAQADEGEGYSSADDPHYGGIGYGGDERPDLSNTQMALEAAARTGRLAPDHPFFHRALRFLERNQNLAETNVEIWPRPGGGELASGNDGGATYMPGNSPAGEVEVGENTYQARSYGSMTYALTKSYLICGLPADDGRVTAAVRWIVDNYTLGRNPGFADQEAGFDGLYYYYLAMGRTLARLPAEALSKASEGSPPPWRSDLTRRLLRNQRVDGSWINEHSPRWFEGSPTLCTAYALLALEAASPSADS